MTTMLIAKVKVGKRVRKDMGDLAGLAARIADIGVLLHPIVVQPDGTLIAGERRLEACKRLGWTHIPVTVVNLDDIVRGEFAENTARKDFTPSELVAITAAVGERERELAQRRMTLGKLSTGSNAGKTRDKLDKIASPLGMSGRTLERAQAIVAAAEAEPEKYGKLVAAMDKTGRVNGPFKRLKVAQQAEVIRAEPPPLPGDGPYRVIVVDPPWPYEIASEDSSIRGVWPFPTMSVAEIASTDVASIAHDNCILWLWTTNYHMQIVFDLLKGWGFQHRTILTWAKHRMGAGDWLRGQTEHAIFAIRGKPVVQLVDQTTLLHAPVRAHSQKPPEFYDFVEKLCPAPRYADLFSRYRHNERWDCHGDQAPSPIAADEGIHASGISHDR
jgi:N6-adenosine-specific RNA methylase IME4/ParB-like chromosome segregation protein Spo0J